MAAHIPLEQRSDDWLIERLGQITSKVQSQPR